MQIAPYTLRVQEALEERQMRRLGAACCLLWNELPEDIREKLLNEASCIHISGENVPQAELRSKILMFVQSGSIFATTDPARS